MTPKPQSYLRPADLALQYPRQTGKMKGFLKSRGVPQSKIEDIISEAWLRGLESLDPSRGLDVVQWVWYILQHNLLPQFGRDRKKSGGTDLLDDPPDNRGDSIDDMEEHRSLIAHLKKHLPSDLRRLLNAMEEVTAQTDSQHIYQEVAERLGLTITQCRNLVKRLKRHSLKLRSTYLK
jgi:DNA-directed RNA polymerase specialized sigma24 family protein